MIEYGHSETAFVLLKNMKTQKHDSAVTLQTDLLDLQKPLFWQLLSSKLTKSFYISRLHSPKHLDEPAYIFANPLLEILSRTPWYVVPICWCPVVLWLFSLSSDYSVFLFLAGIFIWSLMEYCFHRFIFHAELKLPDTPIALALHFLIHGIHHYLPMDRMRLVLPPVLFAALAIGPVTLFYQITPEFICYPMLSGFIAGYIGYDMMHYYLHHSPTKYMPKYFQQMKKIHMAHHYENHTVGYGITSDFWDVVFKTK